MRRIQILLLCTLLPWPAAGMTIKNLEFDVDGVLPSADADIELFNNSGLAEGSLYSVSGGVLQQRTYGIGTGNISYHFPEEPPTAGGLDDSLTTILEARLRVLQIEGPNGGIYFQGFDGTNRYRVAFKPGAVLLSTPTANLEHAIADMDVFHVYRLVSPGNSSQAQLFVDDVLAIDTPVVLATTLNGFSFGDGATDSGINGDADWDYLRVSQVPEPGILVLLGVAIGMAAARSWA